MGEQLRALRGELEAVRVERERLSGRLMDLQVNQGIIEVADERGLGGRRCLTLPRGGAKGSIIVWCGVELYIPPPGV